jgi:hypothetical protein
MALVLVTRRAWSCGSLRGAPGASAAARRPAAARPAKQRDGDDKRAAKHSVPFNVPCVRVSLLNLNRRLRIERLTCTRGGRQMKYRPPLVAAKVRPAPPAGQLRGGEGSHGSWREAESLATPSRSGATRQRQVRSSVAARYVRQEPGAPGWPAMAAPSCYCRVASEVGGVAAGGVGGERARGQGPGLQGEPHGTSVAVPVRAGQCRGR